METIQFGLALKYDSGGSNSADTNAKIAIEVHNSQASSNMWYHIGTVNEATINWGSSHSYSNGYNPSIALNNNNVVVEVHETSNVFTNSLYYKVGQVNGSTVDWGGDNKYDSGSQPQVAINDNGDVVEVHKSQGFDTLWYRVGKINGKSISWGSSHKYDDGVTPSVSINNNGDVVEVHKSQAYDKLWYRVGKISGTTISWSGSIEYQDGVNPSVAITDDGRVVEVHESQGLTDLWQMSGAISENKVVWGSSFNYDSGSKPRIGMSSDGELAIQVHEGSLFGLWFSTSKLMDTANFMGNMLPSIGNVPLKKMTFPATHDAGMYTEGISTLAKTQDLNLFEQLSSGARYFDLRPDKNLNIYHGPITGPSLSDVLADVKKFFAEGHKELAILKFSHFSGFTEAIYTQMKKDIKSELGNWLLTSKPGGATRLADATMGDYLNTGGKVLVVVDNNWAVDYPEAGFWVYRDWESSSASQGDLTVFDIYSNTMSYDTMKKDQLEKLDEFNGQCCAQQESGSWRCQTFSSTPCDLFLLSWTLTPPTGVWFASQEANRNLGDVMANQGPNKDGYFSNLLYLDYFEFARATFVSQLLIQRYNSLITELKKNEELAH